jgi:hypothetical protein
VEKAMCQGVSFWCINVEPLSLEAEQGKVNMGYQQAVVNGPTPVAMPLHAKCEHPRDMVTIRSLKYCEN